MDEHPLKAGEALVQSDPHELLVGQVVAELEHVDSGLDFSDPVCVPVNRGDHGLSDFWAVQTLDAVSERLH